MFTRLRDFFRTHPALREALLWAIPALLFGGFLRGLMLHYIPYAYWGSDSRSYFDFAHKLYSEHYLSLVEKRRFLYPVFLAFVTALPGAPLRWLPWVQHGFGLLTLVPLAYVVRKNFILWRWWIIPVTVAYAGLPVILWYEQELLGENLFFAFLLWAFAGWTAWVREPTRTRAIRLWWLFFIPFACFILTKPSGRFYWPGLALGFLVVAAWRRLALAQYVSIGVLMVVTLFVGDKSQGAWLLYVSAFPLTQLEKPTYPEYKAEIRHLVEPLRAHPDTYYANDGEPFRFLENPARYKGEHPHWAALQERAGGASGQTGQKDSKQERDDRAHLQRKVYLSLALEGILAEPMRFLVFGVDRLVASANLSEFTANRFLAAHVADRFKDDYEGAVARLAKGDPTPIPLALGFPEKGPLPEYSELLPKLNPAPDSFGAHFVPAWISAYQAHADLVRLPPKANPDMRLARPTLLGCWLLAGILLACAVPTYRPALGVWAIAALGYLFGVFLVSQLNPRYFGAAWPVLIPLLAVPADTLFAALLRRKRNP